VARKPEKRRPEANPYLQKFLMQIAWQPKELAVFAGKIDYPSYGPLDRLMIRLIMWMTKGPTDPTTVVEFTDWQQVEAFGRLIGRM
jgi:menaquinone-dependent protoporphyrinogen oxidase